MLQFNKELDYALQLLCVLHDEKEGKCLSLRQFSQDKKISFLFLQRIARKLRQAKIINSTQGASGGYSLKKNLNRVTLKELLEAIDGPYAVFDCLKPNCQCVNSKTCQAHKMFKKINISLEKYLNTTKISDLLEN